MLEVLKNRNTAVFLLLCTTVLWILSLKLSDVNTSAENWTGKDLAVNDDSTAFRAIPTTPKSVPPASLEKSDKAEGRSFVESDETLDRKVVEPEGIQGKTVVESGSIQDRKFAESEDTQKKPFMESDNTQRKQFVKSSKAIVKPDNMQSNMFVKSDDTQAKPKLKPINTQEDRRAQSTMDPMKVLKIHDFNPIASHRHSVYYNFSECTYSQCTFTDDPMEADISMVNAARIKIDPLPPRKPGALLMMYSKEPPTFHRFAHLDREALRGSVNWTRCIYADSTFRAHYNQIIKRRMPAGKDYGAIFEGKRLQVAWFVSHCHTQSKREEYVARLGTQIQVDIFGRCSNRTCGKYGFEMGGQRNQCLAMLSSDYKFYISFENSLCTDYVTEKFYNMYDNIDIIPIVRGGARYREFVPKETFIDTRDFDSPESLGRYLRKLSADKKRYTERLRLKDSYLMVQPQEKFHCTLCEALHTRRHVPSVYPDFYKWLIEHCWEPNDL